MNLAFDRSSVRRYDVDGRMHVELNPISKANICPYLGAEIPDCEALGLDPTKVYRLLRHPDELAKAAGTFNNIQILMKHVPVSADDPQRDIVVGSTGTDGVFEAPYLKNTLVIWDAEGIALVESDRQKELSSAYRYTADMTPGEYEGLPFDGVMRNLAANHVALVPEGRAGPDVVVGDSKLEMPPVATKLKSRKALMLQGAVAAYLRPKLAQDAKIDVSDVLSTITAKNFGTQKAKLVTALQKRTAGKLAADADLEDVVEFIDAFKDVTDGEVKDDVIVEAVEAGDDEGVTADADDDMVAKLLTFLEGKLSDDDLAAAKQMASGQAQDEPPPFEGEPKVDKPAMDAAIRKGIDTAVARVNALHKAREDVKPLVGDVIGMDSAAAVYRFALDKAGVDTAGVHDSALAVLVDQQVKLSAAPAARKPIALDAKQNDEFVKRFPAANRLKTA